jgi:HTH-type transcriptional regulator / antitoxin HigA
MSGRIVNEYAPPTVSPPGATLEEALKERGMSQAELAERTGRPKKTVNEIVKGLAAITPETAIQFERVLGIPASFWNTRQQHYEESIAKAQSERKLLGCVDWQKNFPVMQMVRLGWLPPAHSRIEKLENLLRFFRIGSPDEWEMTLVAPRMGTAFRESRAFQTNRFALSAWIRRGEIEASEMECNRFDREVFESSLREARGMIRSLAEGFDEDLVRLCAKAGVAVVFVPLIKGVHAWGATRWLPGERAMILLSLRGKYEDIFWFSFFHEAAHLLLHGKKNVFVEEDGGERDGAERDADVFARDFLIQPSLWKAFMEANQSFSPNRIKAFASEVEISPAIVVGRLQHEARIERSQLNELRRKMEISAERDS